MFVSSSFFDDEESAESSSKKPAKLSLNESPTRGNDSSSLIKDAPTTPAERRKKLIEQKKAALRARKKKQFSSGRLSMKDDGDDNLRASISSVGSRSSLVEAGSTAVSPGRKGKIVPTLSGVFDPLTEAPCNFEEEKRSVLPDYSEIIPVTNLGDVQASSYETLSPSERNLKEMGIASTFDPSYPTTTEGEEEPARIPLQIDFNDLKSFLMNPVQKGTIAQCFIKRIRTGIKAKMYPTYELYLEEPRKLLMAAKKRGKNRTSNYLISLDRSDLDKSSDSYLGKVRSNFVGTEFVLFDSGVNPTKMKGGREVREELAAILYESNILGSKGPRRMHITIPKINASGQRNKIQPTRSDESIVQLLKNDNIEDLQSLVNKDPQWNDGLGAYVLDFHSRVTMASVKNFQLISADPDEREIIQLQFGRVSKDSFTMDVSYPLSPFQAFGICLSSFDYKIACE